MLPGMVPKSDINQETGFEDERDCVLKQLLRYLGLCQRQKSTRRSGLQMRETGCQQ